MLKLPEVIIYKVLILAITSFAHISGATQSTNSKVGVSAVVAPYCTVTTTTLDFGLYDGAKLRTSATISLWCTKGTVYKITLDGGGSDRNNMRNGTNKMYYSLFQDKDMKKEWGRVASNSFVGTGTATQQQYTVYGIVQEGQKLPQGNYASVLNVITDIDNGEQAALTYRIYTPMNSFAVVHKTIE